MFRTLWDSRKEIELAVKEETDRRDHADDEKDKSGRSVAGEVGDVAQVMRLLFYASRSLRLETFEIGEGQLDLTGLRPGDRGGDGVIRDLGQGGDGRASEMPRPRR